VSGEPVAMHTGFYPRAPDAGVWGPPPKGLSKQTAWGVHSPPLTSSGSATKHLQNGWKAKGPPVKNVRVEN